MKTAEKIRIVADLIAIDSANNHEEQIAGYLLKLFAIYGIKASKITQFPGRCNLVAEIGDGQAPKIGLSGHFDTVSPGDETQWTTSPYSAVIDADTLRGLGASDMKAGVAQLVITMIELKQAGLPRHGTIRFLGTISEELTEEGARLLADQGYADDLDVLLFAEPTGVAIDQLPAYFDSGAARIDHNTLDALLAAAETTQAREQHFIFQSHKGWMTYTVTAHGKAAHSSMPGLGINAVDCLITYYQAEKALYANLMETSAELGATIYAPDIFHGGTQVNSIPAIAYEQVKVRTIPELPNSELINRLSHLIDELNQQPDMNLELTVEQSEVPVANSTPLTFAPFLQHHAHTTLAEPLDLPTISVSLGTDASEFRRRNSTAEMLVVGPGNTSAHQVDEFVSISAYLNMIELLIASLTDYFSVNQKD